MATTLQPPVLSLLDPLQDSEGSVDPLSLQRTYERLADRVLPAVTVRMGRIRFVTAMCLGALVCEAYDEDTVAIDRVTPSWLVFEWFVIAAFAESGEDTRGARIPGLQKVKHCLGQRRQVSAAAYLKTPKVFGFTGIFKRLAVSAHILGDHLRLDTGGRELLSAWAREEGLGDLHGSAGAGAALVRSLRDAVSRGLEAGSTVAISSEIRTQLAARLHPGSMGKAEGQVLLRWLQSSASLTEEHLAYLTQHARYVRRDAEPDFLRETTRRCGAELAAHLSAIDAYEALCRPVVDAFDLVRFLSSHRGLGPVSGKDFAQSPFVAPLVDAIAAGRRRVERDAHLLDWEPDVRAVVDAFAHVRSAEELFDAVVAHHEASQRRKPPDGRRPWLERARDNAVMVRPAYPVTIRAETPASYVHDYRTGTLCGFLTDAGVLS